MWEHKLVLGLTGMGKSCLLRRLIARAKVAGYDALVLDPNGEPDWGAAYSTTDPADFLDVAQRSTECLLVVDEAGETLSRDPNFRWIVTRSRHLGHLAVLSSHGATDILPVMRKQCTEAYIFRQNWQDAKQLALQYSDRLFERAPELAVGQYIHKSGSAPATVKILDMKTIKKRA